MIFNADVLFIHNGKTGGISCARYLMQALPGPIYVCPANAKHIGTLRPENEFITLNDGVNLHCPLSAAGAHMQRSADTHWSAMKKILVVIRHPLSLEYSFYLHLQKPHVRERRKNNPELLRLADGNFVDFIRYAGYHREGMPQEAFFQIDGQCPENLEMIRFENLAEDFTRAAQPFIKAGTGAQFPHLNASKPQNPLHELINDEVLELIYDKHRFMFDSGLYDVRQVL